jgi:hypothetical protein
LSIDSEFGSLECSCFLGGLKNNHTNHQQKNQAKNKSLVASKRLTGGHSKNKEGREIILDRKGFNRVNVIVENFFETTCLKHSK